MEIKVQNLKCGGCASTITKRLSAMDGVFNIEVLKEESKVVFEVQEGTLIEVVKQALHLLGYPEEDSENTFSTQAKSYVSCMIGKLN
jgi:copper chaperone